MKFALLLALASLWPEAEAEAGSALNSVAFVIMSQRFKSHVRAAGSCEKDLRVKLETAGAANPVMLSLHSDFKKKPGAWTVFPILSDLDKLGQGFYETPFRPKTFRINFHSQILDKFRNKNKRWPLIYQSIKANNLGFQTVTIESFNLT
jgi:hypothetical protein